MKIKSRPGPVSIGSGDYTFNMTFEEAQLIASYLYVTRLGGGAVYKHAAFELLNALEEAFDEDFAMEASHDVGLTVSRIDVDDTIIDTLDVDEFTLEVL